MEVDASGKDVGAGQTLETQLGTVGTSTYRLYLRTNTTFLHSLQYDVYHMHVRLYHLLHVVVLVLDFAIHRTLTVFLVHILCTFSHQSLACLKLVAVVVAQVAQEIGRASCGDRAEHAVDAVASNK